MRLHKLRLDDLVVESFHTIPESGLSGTVQGYVAAGDGTLFTHICNSCQSCNGEFTCMQNQTCAPELTCVMDTTCAPEYTCVVAECGVGTGGNQ